MILNKIAKFGNLYRAYVKSYFCFSIPFVRIIPTDMCNLRCAYCWQRKDHSHEMSLGEFNAYLAKAKNLNVGLMTFLGGEPMIWPHLYDALNACRKAHVLTDLTTNGTLLDMETIDKLGRSGLDYLNISVDGIKPTDVTRKNSIVQMETLEQLQRARKKYKMHFRINSVIYKNNFDQIQDLIEFAKKKNVQISLCYIVPPLNPDYIIDPGIYFTQEDNELLRQIVDYIVSKKKQGYPIIDPEQYFVGIFRYIKHEHFWNCNYPTRYGWINVNPDGFVRSCTKKMDSLGYSFLELDSTKVIEIRRLLAQKIQDCNVHCYSNCAFDSYFYTHNKTAFFQKVLRRMIDNVKA